MSTACFHLTQCYTCTPQRAHKPSTCFPRVLHRHRMSYKNHGSPFTCAQHMCVQVEHTQVPHSPDQGFSSLRERLNPGRASRSEPGLAHCTEGETEAYRRVEATCPVRCRHRVTLRGCCRDGWTGHGPRPGNRTLLRAPGHRCLLHHCGGLVPWLSPPRPGSSGRASHHSTWPRAGAGNY